MQFYIIHKPAKSKHAVSICFGCRCYRWDETTERWQKMTGRASWRPYLVRVSWWGGRWVTILAHRLAFGVQQVYLTNTP